MGIEPINIQFVTENRTTNTKYNLCRNRDYLTKAPVFLGKFIRRQKELNSFSTRRQQWFLGFRKQIAKDTLVYLWASFHILGCLHSMAYVHRYVHSFYLLGDYL